MGLQTHLVIQYRRHRVHGVLLHRKLLQEGRRVICLALGCILAVLIYRVTASQHLVALHSSTMAMKGACCMLPPPLVGSGVVAKDIVRWRVHQVVVV